MGDGGHYDCRRARLGGTDCKTTSKRSLSERSRPLFAGSEC